MFFNTIMAASQSPAREAGTHQSSTSHATSRRRNAGAFLDAIGCMTNTIIDNTPVAGRKLMNPPLPAWEISGPVARKIPRRVLVVDDEPLIRWSVTETLAGLGLDVEQAADAASALRVLT